MPDDVDVLALRPRQMLLVHRVSVHSRGCPVSETDPGRIAFVDQQNAEINDLLNQQIRITREQLAEAGTDPGDLAVVIAQMFYATDPGRAATLAGFALVRLAQLPDGESR